MQLILLISAATAVLLGVWYFLRRRRKRTRMVSFVALLREPTTIDPYVLAKTAGRAFDADLGDGTDPGADGFVVSVGLLSTINHDERMYVVHCMPTPYVDDPEAAAASIVDLRVRDAMSEHAAWLSCDALGVDHGTPEAEVRELYRRLAKLFVVLLDDNCLLIYLPDLDRAFPINDETQAALASDDPVAALLETQSLPVIPIESDDPLLVAAAETARSRWATFLAAFEGSVGENHAIKAAVTRAENTEHIWISVTAVEGDHVYGRLANEPANLGPLKLGSKVQIPVAEVEDWCYVDPKGDVQGGFSIEAVKAAARRKPKR